MAMDQSVHWVSTNTDIIISTIIGLGLGHTLAILYEWTGVLLPLLVYYSLCIAVPLWRRDDSKMLHYDNPISLLSNCVCTQVCSSNNSCIYTPATSRKTVKSKYRANCLFWSLLVETIATMIIYGFIIQTVNDQYYLYSLVWSFINAFCEQLLWFYVLDSFTNRYNIKYCKDIDTNLGKINVNIKVDSIQLNHITSDSQPHNPNISSSENENDHECHNNEEKEQQIQTQKTNNKNIFTTVIGYIVFTFHLWSIHFIFWESVFQSETKDDADNILVVMFGIGSIVYVVGWVWLWKMSHSMTGIFILHLIVNITIIVVPKYSIFTVLIK